MDLIIKDLADLAVLDRLLDVDAAFSEGESVGRITEGVDEVEFQTHVVDTICGSETGLWCLEAGTGCGKTIIAALASIHYVRQSSRTVYICPSVTSLNDDRGVRAKFKWVFDHYNVKARFGKVNEATKTCNVLFFTPTGWSDLHDTNRALYRQLLADTGLMVVDEAHHFASDHPAKVFGRVYPLAEAFAQQGRVLSMTGTHGRLDGGHPMGQALPDVRVTVQDLVLMRRCPPVHGIRVFIDVDQKSKVTNRQGTYDLGLKGRSSDRYWRNIVGAMLRVWGRAGNVATCAFTRTVSEARMVVSSFNSQSGLNERGLVLLCGSTPMERRKEILRDIQEGRVLGYVTCGVGEESLDVPRMEVVHLIRRTRSVTKNAQAIGRALRLSSTKKRALVIDYQVCRDQILKMCVGLAEYARLAGFTGKLVNGGPLTETPFDHTEVPAEFLLMSLGDEEVWVSAKYGVVDAQVQVAILRALADAGGPSPSAFPGVRNVVWDVVRKELAL